MLRRLSWLVMLLAALTVAAPALGQGPSGPGAVIFSAPSGGSVSGNTITLAGATGRNIRIYGVWAFCSAGAGTLYISDSTNSTTLWQSVSGAVTTSMFTAPNAQSFQPAPLWGATSATLTIRLVTTGGGAPQTGSCGNAVPGTININADRY